MRNLVRVGLGLISVVGLTQSQIGSLGVGREAAQHSVPTKDSPFGSLVQDALVNDHNYWRLPDALIVDPDPGVDRMAKKREVDSIDLARPNS